MAPAKCAGEAKSSSVFAIKGDTRDMWSKVYGGALECILLQSLMHLKDVRVLPEMSLSDKAFLTYLYKALGSTSSTENQTPRYVNVAF